jgi:hypothetical protein
MKWLWVLALLIPVVLYGLTIYSSVKVAKKPCSTCPYAAKALDG